MNKVATLLLLAGSLFCTGCVGTIADAERSNLINSGQPAEYADGYRDGYQAGQRAAGNPYARHAKDVNRYLTDPKYKMGWDDGHAAGLGQYSNLARQ